MQVTRFKKSTNPAAFRFLGWNSIHSRRTTAVALSIIYTHAVSSSLTVSTAADSKSIAFMATSGTLSFPE